MENKPVYPRGVIYQTVPVSPNGSATASYSHPQHDVIRYKKKTIWR